MGRNTCNPLLSAAEIIPERFQGTWVLDIKSTSQTIANEASLSIELKETWIEYSPTILQYDYVISEDTIEGWVSTVRSSERRGGAPEIGSYLVELKEEGFEYTVFVMNKDPKHCSPEGCPPEHEIYFHLRLREDNSLELRESNARGWNGRDPLQRLFVMRRSDAPENLGSEDTLQSAYEKQQDDKQMDGFNTIHTDTLQSTFEKDERNNGVDYINIIHIEENEQYGLVVHTSWTEDYIQNKDRPGISVYHKVKGKWTRSPGTSCGSTGAYSKMGIQNGLFLYCGIIAEEPPYVPYVKITVGETEASIFEVTEKIKIWYAVVNSMDLKMVGSYATGD